MTNNTTFKILIAFVVFCCFHCNKPPCPCNFNPMQNIEVKFINQQNQNLIFGPNSIYEIDSIQVLEKKDSFNINNASVRKGLLDSNNVEFDFYVPTGKSYLYYNQQTELDSVEIKWLTKSGKCCGNPQQYNVVDSVKFNNAFIKPVNGIYYFVK